jgi:excisionase family DNA binding protein
MTTQLLTPEQVAKQLGVSIRTLRDMPLKRVRLTGRLVRYRLADVEAYIAKRTKEAA